MDKELRRMILGLVAFAAICLVHDIWYVATGQPVASHLPFLYPLVCSVLATGLWKYRSRL